MRGHHPVAIAALFAIGCSFVHVGSPRRPAPGQRPDCDPDSSWPLVDATMAMTSYTGALATATWLTYADVKGTPGLVGAISLLALGLSGWAWSFSYLYGETNTYSCNDQHREAR